MKASDMIPSRRMCDAVIEGKVAAFTWRDRPGDQAAIHIILAPELNKRTLEEMWTS